MDLRDCWDNVKNEKKAHPPMPVEPAYQATRSMMSIFTTSRTGKSRRWR